MTSRWKLLTGAALPALASGFLLAQAATMAPAFAASCGGADIDPGTNDSIRGGAGVRLGVDAEMIRASVTGRVWDVFDNDNEVDVTPAGPVLALSDDTLEGVYGEVAGQIDLDLSSSTVLFARGSYLFSDNIGKPSVSGGLSFFW